MTGLTLDAGALIALEAGNRRVTTLVEEAVAARAELAVPAWRHRPGVAGQCPAGADREAAAAHGDVGRSP